MGRARHVTQAADGFAAVLGQRRGNTGAADLAAGRMSAAARRHLDALTHAVAAGECEDALELLRAHEKEDESGLAPVFDAVLAYAYELALTGPWLQAARSFAEATCLQPREARTIIHIVDDVMHIWPAGSERVTAASDEETITLACGDRHGWAHGPEQYGHPPYPVSRARRGQWAAEADSAATIVRLGWRQLDGPGFCARCAEHAHEYPETQESGDYEVWEVIDRAHYERVLTRHLHSDLARMLATLRTDADITDWMTASAIQGALLEVVVEQLLSPAGEDAIHRGLGEAHYRAYLEKALSAGAPGLYAVLDEKELREGIRHLLPHADGEYEPTSFDDDGAAIADIYHVAIACGLDRLPPST